LVSGRLLQVSFFLVLGLVLAGLALTTNVPQPPAAVVQGCQGGEGNGTCDAPYGSALYGQISHYWFKDEFFYHTYVELAEGCLVLAGSIAMYPLIARKGKTVFQRQLSRRIELPPFIRILLLLAVAVGTFMYALLQSMNVASIWVGHFYQVVPLFLQNFYFSVHPFYGALGFSSLALATTGLILLRAKVGLSKSFSQTITRYTALMVGIFEAAILVFNPLIMNDHVTNFMTLSVWNHGFGFTGPTEFPPSKVFLVGNWFVALLVCYLFFVAGLWGWIKYRTQKGRR
jgi:hypothetical protein